MKAITRLRMSGLSAAQIAESINDKSGGHLVRAYEKHKRFPGRDSYARLVELAESRGITLTARDFMGEATEQQRAA